MLMSKLTPLVGVSACRNAENIHPFHRAGEKYILALKNPAGCAPVIIPALGDDAPLTVYADRLDGILLTGSPSNVQPERYNGDPSEEGTKHDSYRDATTLPLIRYCVERGIPVLGLCLGIQELNVALGGSLHQNIADLDNKFDHRMRRDIGSYQQRYRHAHNIRITEGSLLHRLLGQEEILVNSLHAQGIDQLGEGIRVDAVAPDGVIEAVSLPGSSGFVLGVQWHPELPWPIEGNSRKIFEAFGDACRVYASKRIGRGKSAAE